MLHAARKVDAHGAVGQAGARGDFGAAHAFDEPEDERLAIGFGERADGFESGAGFGGGVGSFRSGELRGRCGIFGRRICVERNIRFCVAVKIGGAIAGDGGEPAGKIVGIAEGSEFRECLEEDVLHEVFDVTGRDAAEENAVNHAGVTRIEMAVGGAIAILRGADKRSVGSAGIERGIHGWKPGVR